MAKIVTFPSAQDRLIAYIRSLDRESATAELRKLLRMTDYGAKVNGTALAALFNRLGYDGRAETARMDYEFADRLAELYREICSD